MKKYKQVVDAMQDAGIFFYVNHCSPLNAFITGGQIDLDAEEVLFILAEGIEAYHAKSYGITVDQFREWKGSDGWLYAGVVRCAAITNKGVRCKNITHTRLDPDKWAELVSQKTYCPAHSKRIRR